MDSSEPTLKAILEATRLAEHANPYDDAEVMAGTRTTAEAHLLGCPVRELEAELARERDLIRELTLMRIADPSRAQHSGPASLLRLVEDLERHNRDLAVTTSAIREQALMHGSESVDVHYTLTPEAGPKLARVAHLFDELDELTRDDDHLLTLPPTQEMVRLRRWYFGQLVTQLAGSEPIPWPECPA